MLLLQSIDRRPAAGWLSGACASPYGDPLALTESLIYRITNSYTRIKLIMQVLFCQSPKIESAAPYLYVGHHSPFHNLRSKSMMSFVATLAPDNR